jgi:hypothetical protein
VPDCQYTHEWLPPPFAAAHSGIEGYRRVNTMPDFRTSNRAIDSSLTETLKGFSNPRGMVMSGKCGLAPGAAWSRADTNC